MASNRWRVEQEGTWSEIYHRAQQNMQLLQDGRSSLKMAIEIRLFLLAACWFQRVSPAQTTTNATSYHRVAFLTQNHFQGLN